MYLYPILVSVATLGLSLLLQSTLLHYIAIFGVIPDISLIILLFISLKSGPFLGETSGFIAGLIQDSISLAPFGFNAFIKTLLGFLAGMTKGRIYVKGFLMPLIFVFSATLIKKALTFFLVKFFSISIAVTSIFSSLFWIEALYNMILTPLLFYLLSLLFSWLLIKKTGGSVYDTRIS